MADEKQYSIEELEGFFRVAMQSLSISFETKLDEKFKWFREFMEEKVKSMSDSHGSKMELIEARHDSELTKIYEKLEDLEARGREAIDGHIKENKVDISRLKESLGRAFAGIEKNAKDIEDIQEAPVIKKAELVDDINKKIRNALIAFFAGGIGVGGGLFILDLINNGLGG